MDMVSLQKLVEENCPFTLENYPDMPKHSERAEMLFMLRHIQSHFVDEVLELGRQLDLAEHGGAIDSRRMRNIMRNMLINTLRWHAATGLSADQAVALVIQKFTKDDKMLA